MNLKLVICLVLFPTLSCAMDFNTCTEAAKNIFGGEYHARLGQITGHNDYSEGEACTGLGVCYSIDLIRGPGCHGMTNDYHKAKTYFERACVDFNEGLACLKLALFYDEGKGVRQDKQQAKSYYEKSCSLNNPTACFRLGMLYQYDKGGIQSFEKAKEYYGKACDMGGIGSQMGCDSYRELNEKGY